MPSSDQAAAMGRRWLVERLLALAVWATRSATRLDRHQKFGVWERSRA